MASLENKKIKDTYEGLLKTDDNAAIDGAVEITDGAGNGTGVTISNDGQVTATGTVSFGSLKDTGEDITVTKFVDEADGIGNNDNDTSIPTSAAVKDYVDTNVTAQDLDFQGDTGTGAVDLDSQSLDIAGGTGIDTAASGQTLTVNIDSTVATLSDTQTLTNKSIDLTDNTLSGTTSEFNAALSDDDFATLTGTETLTNKTVDADNNTVSNLEVDNLKSGVLDTDLTSVSASDDTLASAKAIKTYVDSNITAQDLDITDGTTTSAVDLDSQTLTIEGTANEVEVSLTDQTFTVGLPTSITTNVTGDLTGNADTASALETARTISLSGDVAGSVSFDGSANADITATIQANSVALGTDTTGDYVENLGTGTGVTIGSNTGEGSSPTISVDYGSTANTAVQGDTSLTIQGTANEIEVTGGGVTLGSGGTVTVGLPDNVSLGGSLTIAQNLTVNGTTTTVNTDTLSVEDPLIELARDNSENSVDVGLYGKYSLDSGVTTKYSGLFKDASDSDKFKLFKGLEVEPTSTVDTSGTGYTKGDLVINDLDAVDGAFSGDVTLSSGIISATENSQAQGVFKGWSTTGANGSSGAIRLGDNASYQGRIDYAADGNTEFMFDNTYASGIYTFSIAGSEKLRLDSSGDLTLDPNGNGAAYLKLNTLSGASGDGHIILQRGGTNKFQIAANNSNALTFYNYTAGSTSMTIDSSGRVGIGVSSPAALLSLQDGSTEDVSGSKIRMELSGINPYWEIIARNGGTSANRQLGFYTSSIGSDVMTLTQSGQIGIGTSSPSASLSIDKTNVNQHRALDLENDSITYSMYIDQDNIGTDSWSLFDTSNSQTALRYLPSASGYWQFYTNNTERMRIDSSGNVLVGTDTVLAGAANRGNITINGTSSAILSFGKAGALQGYLYHDGSQMLLNTGTSPAVFEVNASERMRIDSSGKTTFTKSSGAGIVGSFYDGTYGVDLASTSSGASIQTYNTNQTLNFNTYGTGYFTFTSGSSERMRIDSSGNVGIGTSSPSFPLHVVTDSGTYEVVTIQNGSSAALFRAIGSGGGSVDFGAEVGTADTAIIRTGSTERMRIDSIGRVGIGTSSPSTPLEVNVTGNNTVFSLTRDTGTNGELTIRFDGANANFDSLQGGYSFKTNSTERMQITSGGSLLIGTTSSGGAGGVTITPADSAGAPSYVTNRNSTTAASTIFEFRNGGSAVGSITHSSSVTSYNSASDYRLKENVVDMTGALDRVDQLEPKRFNFIADEDTTVDGFLAHEVQDIVPEAVTGEKDAVDEDGNDIYQGIDQSKLVPLLVGAIKELRAEVNSLKAQINN